jgi:hypothetical protein
MSRFSSILNLGKISSRQTCRSIFTKPKFSPAPKSHLRTIYTPLRSVRGLTFLSDIKKCFPVPVLPVDLFCNKYNLSKIFHTHGSDVQSNYLIDKFIDLVASYSIVSRPMIDGYYSGKISLNQVCVDFARFCLRNKVQLDARRVLEAFSAHNALLDIALQRKLLDIPPMATLNLLGFGLGDGLFEKKIAQFLVEHNIATEVNIYGYDPYAVKDDSITYFADTEFSTKPLPKFDIIISRWVLHHIAPEFRWHDFINCINNCNVGAIILVIEHGIMQEENTLEDKKSYRLITGLYDTLANLGLRPGYFTNSAPKIGADFFVDYLENTDFEYFTALSKYSIQTQIEDIGPIFPNQTIYCMRLGPK